jgi:hypothetical protein
MSKWSHKGYLVQHWQAMHYEAEIELYVGAGGRAYERVHRDMRALRSSILLRAHVVRVFTAYLRGRCAIASIPAATEQRRARIAEARRAASDLARERSAPWAHALGSIVRASAENEAGDRAAAIAWLRRAVEGCVQADLALHASAVRFQLGTAIGGDEGAALIEQGTEAMAAQGVRIPSRMADRLVPGHWRPASASAP